MADSSSTSRNDGTAPLTSASPGPGGQLQLPKGIDPTKLWLEQVGNDLEIIQIGTTNIVTEAGFFDPNARHPIGGLVTSSGLVLEGQVQQLVNAMATFSAGNPAFNPMLATQMPDDRGLQAAVTAAWLPSR